MTESLCTCGKRPKHKCCEESEHKSGKMCLNQPMFDFPQGYVFPERMGILTPGDLIERIKALRQKAEENKPKPNNLSVEDTFDIMFGRYQHALEELSEK